ncbi:MAG: DNA/RNA non-specific endonuclease [Burkholderiales bacterium]|nr:DNA/RNA non-specific endonuclease [Burkholderiales bacterium]
MRLIRFFLGVLFSLGLAGCELWPASCPQLFYQGAVPEVSDKQFARRTARICYDEFAVLHSGVSRTPLWSAEHLTAAQLERARHLRRKNAFHVEEWLFPFNRAELEDYVRSGFDRGHMAPSADMSTEYAQYESFSLANMVPQHPKNNQILWEGIEHSTRNLAQESGELFVITGPIFEGNTLRRLNGHVLVPSHVFKAIYDPVRKQGAAYIAENTDGWRYSMVSIAELEKRIRINLFPAVDSAIKATAMELPSPQPRRQRRGKANNPGARQEEEEPS